MKELVVAIFVLMLVLLLAIWYDHISTVKTVMATYKYGYANYRKFKREISKSSFDDLEFSAVKYACHYNKHNCVDYSLIAFNDIGMIINNPISYLFVCIYIFRIHKQKDKERLYKW